MSIFYDLVAEDEIRDAHAIEVSGYPEDEAGTLEAFQYRQSQAPDLFLGAYLPTQPRRTLVAYVCSTLSPDPTLTHASMSTHVPSAPSVCIHSVCVAPEHRRKGVALALLREYLSRLERSGHTRALLITHEELRGLYEQAGFEWAGPSAVVHGARPWFEMWRALAPAPSEAEPSVPPGLWEALQRSSARSRPRGRLLATFPNGLADVSERTEGGGPATNAFDLLCPREGCGSVLLKAGVAGLTERESVRLEPPEFAHGSLPRLPAPPAPMQWWRVVPNAMAFENVGFSRGVDLAAPSGKNLKLLLCAECDLGPLGWCEEGGSEFWLACTRVSYRE
ncbi:acyl-CoA N-acyltransferase [Amylocystis lapponica]|nr:acyl-CoA N-acyltransferase [Amylocystis lapponica]